MARPRDSPTRKEILQALHAVDVDEIELLFDELWYDLPDRFAPEVLAALVGLPPVVVEQRPRLTDLALLAHRRATYDVDDGSGLARMLELATRAGLRYGNRLGTFSRMPDLVAAGTASVMAHRYRRSYDVSERLGAWVDARVVQSSPRSVLPWGATETRFRPGWLSLQRGITAMLGGAVDPAVKLFDRARTEAGDEPHAHYAGLLAAAHLALLSAFHGHFELARDWLRGSSSSVPVPAWIGGSDAGVGAVVRAQIAVEEGDPESALGWLRAVRRSSDLVELWPFLAFTRAAFQAHYGDPVRGLRELDEARLAHGTVDADPATLTGRLLLRAEAKLLLRTGGGVGRVLRFAHDHDDVPWLAASHAWAHLTVGEHHEAVRLASSSLQGSARSSAEVIDLHVVLAVAHLRSGREDRARTWFQSAVRLRASPRHIAPFLSMHRDELETLTRLAGVPSLLRGGAVEIGHNPPAPVASVRLSPREREVLQALGEGHTAESAAKKSGVAITTVRTQIRKIYEKLGAANRREALATAQELGLLDANRAPGLRRARVRNG
ncbi:hypothetical protein JN535_00810 [Cellulosimicrobium cellulans]|uniref:helix-turn-helix domain-containing protein n=1 Tax=Cellulosimicrobium cellulans TaxID=1710 RepID=UPI0019643EA1|nr:helix-turn-helix transcriptional regulator [Cellulosimicrobium cellulans]MBN0038710.1 hypothetical protein [Cellulosimicrobium cellulans]